MMIDQIEVRARLRFMAFTTTAEVAFHEDLFQEALIFIWQKELAFPGQTEAYYFKSCKCHMIDYLRLGRSVDAPKRARGRCNGNGNECKATPKDGNECN